MLTSSNMRVLGHLALLLFASPLLAQSPPTYQTELNTLADRVAHDIKAVPVTPAKPRKILVVDFVNDKYFTNALGAQLAAAFSEALETRLEPGELISNQDFQTRLMAARYSPADLQDNDALLRMTARIGANLIITGRLFAFRKSTTLQLNLVTVPDGAGQNSTSADLTILPEALKLLNTPVDWPILPYSVTSCDLRPWLVPQAFAAAGVTQPHCITCPKPDYPQAAKDARWQGSVLLNVTIDELGHVVMAKTNQPAPYNADDAAIDAVKKWTMDPATKDGKPVKVCIPTLVNFRPGQ
jgi:TonB family protein